ncbi:MULTISPECIES: FAD-dependent oxidoreductase [Thermomonas]|uniref:FAD-dependent oxidoreductase n=1 Tax=Thermomonas beijingensis TaxID=2872701 RepID=A0ABS7TDK5_9GAMM|nr:FAD-dependent oxidoreductase [Thermomonas beijingensis]MBS0459885.1 FAD-dependent oxidoreductase [Pseudomonadota bacterium]MBZ4185932.1 FAD-dependent oxidoreductase [Thermomonas beijingensis]MDE2380609.1 FAD-dependent oxidoreductase [Xanthomonadaceae bacterium]
MSRRGRLDAVVVGGGVVGAASALMLAREGLQVALVEAQRPTAWTREQRDLRVFAFAPDNAALLARLGVWAQVLAARAQPYRGMRVWDAASGDPLVFDADALGERQLGWIVENAVLVDALWQALPGAGVRVHCPARVEQLEQLDTGVRIGLDDGLVLEAQLAIAADGGHSALRRLAGIEAPVHDYQQRGLVAFVASEIPHRRTCWQRFLPTGPVAFLPFSADGDAVLDARLGSIVWTLPTAEAQRLLDTPPAQFENELSTAFGGELGALSLQSARAAFPLRRQLAHTQVKDRVLLVGDAAHVMHPLAGQGVNHGLRDVAALQTTLGAAQANGGDITSPARLARWARTRRSENALGAHAFEAINRVYSNDALLPTLLRGSLLGIAGRLPPLTRALWRHAAGK